jgi:polysaccharide export outer membrane protein
VLFALCVGCRSADDARVLQVLNQRGFGRPTQDANREYYIGIGDTVVIRDPNHPMYNGVVEAVRMDGVVTLPDVGAVYVNGLTPDEATQVVAMRYEDYVTNTDSISVEVTSINSKQYYITGAPPRKPQAANFNGDITLIDALVRANMNESLIDTDQVLVIRGDPENPLVIACNYEDISRRGLTRDNILIRENDIIYLKPSFVGYIAWGVDIALAPLTPIKEFIYGSSNILSAVDSFGSGTGGKKGFNQGSVGF